MYLAPARSHLAEARIATLRLVYLVCLCAGILLRMIPTQIQSEHMHEHEVRVLEFLAELALAIPPELARAILLDLACALDGGDPPRPCSLGAYYLGCPTY